MNLARRASSAPHHDHTATPHPRALLAVAALCVLAWLVIAWFASPGIVYAKIHSDSGIYLAQARHLWTTGSADRIVIGDGMAAIVYSPLTAYLRAPLLAWSADASTLVRLVQLQNLAILILLALVSSRYLERRLPFGASRRWRMFPWIALTVGYNPWSLNLVLPLGDHLYALLTMSALLLASAPHAATTGRGGTARLAAVIGLVALGAAQKFTSLALLPAIVLAQSRSRRQMLAIVLPMLVAGGTICWFGRGLFTAYIEGAFVRYMDGRPLTEVVLNTLVNLFVAALPNQIVPDFTFLYHRDFSATNAVQWLDVRAANAGALALGGAITLTILYGAWRSRIAMTQELVCVALVTPIYAIVTNSTGRYLSSLQPVFLVWLVFGLQAIRPLVVNAFGRIPIALRRLLPWLAGSMFAYGVVLTAVNLSRSFTAQSEASVQHLDGFLSRLDEGFVRGHAEITALRARNPDSALLYQVDDIRWYGLDGARYVAPARTTAALCAGRAVYAVFACDRRNCKHLELQRDAERMQVALAGLRFEPIYTDEGDWGLFMIEQAQLANRSICRSGT